MHGKWFGPISGRWAGWLLGLATAAALSLTPAPASAQWQDQSGARSGNSGSSSDQDSALRITRDPSTGRVVIRGRLPGASESMGAAPGSLEPSSKTGDKPNPRTDEPASP